MTTNKISFFFIIPLFASFLIAQASEVFPDSNAQSQKPLSLVDNDYLQAWKTSYIDHMTLQEQQILANIIHLLHANSVIEFKIRQFSTPIARLNQSIKTNIDQYKNTAEDIAILKTLIERLSFVVSTRTIYAQTLSTCMTHYNKNTVSIIDAALTSLQLYAQTKLRDWANEKTNETVQQLKKSSTKIGDTVQHFEGISKLHKAMSEGQLPSQIGPVEEENKSIVILSIILKNNAEIYAVTQNVINSLNETSDHAAHIINTGAEIYKSFYSILYDVLMSSSSDKKYATTLFGMYDTLSDEYKSLLPDANHVFEHTLQTTKMYTQTEFLQS